MRRIIVEKIPWLYACCDSLITAEDIASASRFQNDRRRTEHLAWRRVVRRELGRNISIHYNEVGAPVVDTENTYISVAHGAERVAVVISDQRVGIDIESLEREFDRVSSRYMSCEEQLLSDAEHWAAIVWCSKEALYKLYGKRGVNLIGDINIVGYNADSQQLRARIEQHTNAIVEVSVIDDIAVTAVAYFDNNIEENKNKE